MEAKDGSEGFDFEGVYEEIEENRLLQYKMSDDRVVRVEMKEQNGQTHVSVTFDLEEENSAELQREGWQAILDNFKKYAESKQ